MKRYVEMPAELIEEATDILTYKDALDSLFNRFIKEVATNKYQTIQFWGKAEAHLVLQNVKKAEDEVLIFDFIQSKFFIVPKAKE